MQWIVGTQSHARSGLNVFSSSLTLLFLRMAGLHDAAQKCQYMSEAPWVIFGHESNAHEVRSVRMS